MSPANPHPVARFRPSPCIERRRSFGLPSLALAFALGAGPLACTCTRTAPGETAAAPALAPAPPDLAPAGRPDTPYARGPLATPNRPGDLPPDATPVLDDLYARDLEVVRVKKIRGIVARLELRRGEHRFRAKWKPMGPEGSEVEEGVPGNDAPRCESAAFRLNRLLFGAHDSRHYLVAPVAVRAFHRDVPCFRACTDLPVLPGSVNEPATFPELNPDLVLGTVTYWIDDVKPAKNFNGGLWNPERFQSDPLYRRSFADLNLFLFLINHGDANAWSNFLLRQPQRDRIYSIDNGIAFSAPRFYLDNQGHDWDPFKNITLDTLVAPAYSAGTLAAAARLDRPLLERALRVTGAINLFTGESVEYPDAPDSPVAPLLARPLSEWKGARRRSAGLYTGTINGVPWAVLGLTEKDIDDLAARCTQAGTRLANRTFPDPPANQSASRPANQPVHRNPNPTPNQAAHQAETIPATSKK